MQPLGLIGIGLGFGEAWSSSLDFVIFFKPFVSGIQTDYIFRILFSISNIKFH